MVDERADRPDRLTAMPAWLPAIIVCVIPLLCAAAYAIGRCTGRGETIPWRPIFQLVDHRLRCLGQDRATVRAELCGRLPVAACAWDELLTMRRPLGRLRQGGGGP